MNRQKLRRTVVFIFRSCGEMAGMERGTLNLFKFIDFSKVRVVVIMRRGNAWQTYQKEAPDVLLHDFPFTYEEKRGARFIRAWTLFRSLKATKVIWLHNNIGDFYVWEILASWMVTFGNLYMSHHSFPVEGALLKKNKHEQYLDAKNRMKINQRLSFLLRHLLARKILTLTSVIRDGLVYYWGIPANHIEISPRGVDTDFFQPNSEERDRIRKELSIGPREKVFLAVTRFSKEKRIDRLLGAFLLYQKRGGAGKLLIAGDGPQKIFFKERIRKEKILKEQTVLLGFREDIARILQASDFMLLTSDKEGQSTVVKEAMACGVIPIATDSPGTRLISPLVFITPRNVFNFASEMQKVAQTETRELEDISRQCMGEIKKKFDFEKCSKKMLQTFLLPVQ